VVANGSTNYDLKFELRYYSFVNILDFIYSSEIFTLIIGFMLILSLLCSVYIITPHKYQMDLTIILFFSNFFFLFSLSSCKKIPLELIIAQLILENVVCIYVRVSVMISQLVTK
jgi:hypothetical protein